MRVSTTHFIVACFGFGLLLGATIPACMAQHITNESIAQTVNDLKAKASDGLVRIIVMVQPDPSQPAPLDAHARAQAVMEAKATLVRSMRNAGAAVVEPIEGQPLIVMELSSRELDKLVSTGLVEALQEDRPERAQ
jgi:hypothetical protein